MFRTNRGLLKYLVLSLITFDIYSIFVFSHISEEINIIATPRDGKHTMHYCLIFFIFSWLTLGIAPLVWMHRICNRIGKELRERSLPYIFGAEDFWLWGFFGSLIIIGPFVFLHKFFKAMNLVNADFNVKRA